MGLPRAKDSKRPKNLESNCRSRLLDAFEPPGKVQLNEATACPPRARLG